MLACRHRAKSCNSFRSLPGSGWLVEWARRCGDPFRGEPGEPLQAGDRAARAYAEAVQHLTERGLGQEGDILLQGHVAKGFAKQPYWTLAPAARKFLQELHVPAWSFIVCKCTSQPASRRSQVWRRNFCQDSRLLWGTPQAWQDALRGRLRICGPSRAPMSTERRQRARGRAEQCNASPCRLWKGSMRQGACARNLPCHAQGAVISKGGSKDLAKDHEEAGPVCMLPLRCQVLAAHLTQGRA